MITIKLDLSDGMRRELEARLKDGAHASIEDYVRDLIASDLNDDDGEWEMTPELAAALAEGAASGVSSRSVQDIFEDVCKRHNA